MKTNPINDDVKCTLCNRGGEDGLSELVVSPITAHAICADCAEAAFFLSKRMAQLKVMALETASTRSKDDPDAGTDNCKCAGCVYDRLVHTDHIMATLIERYSGMFNASEVVGTRH